MAYSKYIAEVKDKNNVVYGLIDSDGRAMLNGKASVDGYYEQMTVGNSEQLVATVGVEDKVPYLFRTSGGSADIGDREVDKIIGGSIAWNQGVQDGNFTSTSYWKVQNANSSLSVSNNVATVTVNNGTLSAYNPALSFGNQTGWKQISNHVYLFMIDVYAPITTNVYFGGASPSITGVTTEANAWKHCQKLIKQTVNENGELFGYLGMSPVTGISIGDSISFRNMQLFDLTQIFGSTIADYIYTLETANAGTGIAWFRNLFPKPYYAYNAGQLMSVCTNAHRMTGFNQWDEEWELGAYSTSTGAGTPSNNTIRTKNAIKIVPATSYTIKASGAMYLFFYDAQGNFLEYVYENTNSNGYNVITTPNNAYYLQFYKYGTTYNNDICINLHWDGERDGEYEPYSVRTYPLDDVELRGIPKLDSANKLYYDGDVYESDGTVTRKYGIVDLGSLGWTYSSARQFFYVNLTGIKNASGMICPIYSPVGVISDANMQNSANMTIGQTNNTTEIKIKNTSYSDATAFGTAMSGVYLIYELATPTTDSADAYQNPQVVDDWGTEEYVDALATAQTSPRDVAVPVGHDTMYRNNLRAKLEMAPESPESNGDYIVRHSNGQNVYVPITFPADELPAAPSSNGTYVLKCTVSGGTATYSWVSQ